MIGTTACILLLAWTFGLLKILAIPDPPHRNKKGTANQPKTYDQP